MTLRLYARHYNEDDALEIIGGEPVQLAPGAEVNLSWRVPETGNQPIACIGIEISGENGASGSHLPGLAHMGRRAQHAA